MHPASVPLSNTVLPCFMSLSLLCPCTSPVLYCHCVSIILCLFLEFLCISFDLNSFSFPHFRLISLSLSFHLILHSCIAGMQLTHCSLCKFCYHWVHVQCPHHFMLYTDSSKGAQQVLWHGGSQTCLESFHWWETLFTWCYSHTESEHSS